MARKGEHRKPGNKAFVMGDEHRVKIRNSNILNALIEHVEGKREMSATQVTAGLGLLKKVMHDLNYSEKDVNVKVTDLQALVDDIRGRGITIHNYDDRIGSLSANSPKPH